MKKYLSFFRIKFINNLQYRASAYAGVATQFFWGFMEILIFAAFYRANESSFPMRFHELSSYVWLQQATLALFMMWFFDNELFAMITSGNVAYELCRPMDIYNMWYIKNAAGRASKALLRCIPILLIALFLPPPYSLLMPTSISVLFLFLLSMTLAFLVVLSFSMIIYAISFFTVSSMGVKLFAVSVSEFLSGAVIPLPFFPDKIYDAVNLLPWASMQNTPFRIYSGNLSGTEAVNSICLQVFWLVVLTAIGKILLNKGLKKVVVQGG